MPLPIGDVTPQGLGFLLEVAHRARRRNWELALGGLGLTAAQATLLRIIVAHPGNGVRWLSRELQSDATNVQRVAESLLTKGLCERRQDPDDARRLPFYPTEEGVRRAAVAARAAQRVEHQLQDALGPTRYRQLVAGLSALLRYDTAASEGTTP